MIQFPWKANTTTVLHLPEGGDDIFLLLRLASKPVSFTLPYWYDLHCHMRQGAKAMKAYVKATKAMFCEGFMAMGNTLPPVRVPLGRNTKLFRTAQGYLGELNRAGAKGMRAMVSIYLTANFTREDVYAACRAGFFWFKAYPPHGTTNSESAAPLEHYAQNGVLAAIQEMGGYLQVHGEASDIPNHVWFDKNQNAETLFYTTVMPKIRKQFRTLKIICEHITTKAAVEFVRKAGKYTAATICPQHLLYTVGDLLKLFSSHLVCMPLVKFEEDLLALRQAATAARNRRFFAGTDSAPHPDRDKHTPCGCAAGCFSGGYAPQYYVEAFEKAGLDMAVKRNQRIFERFLVTNGATFYGLPVPTRRFRLTRVPQRVTPIHNGTGKIYPFTLGANYSRPRRRFMPTYTAWTAEAA